MSAMTVDTMEVDDCGAGTATMDTKPANPGFSQFMQGFWDLTSTEGPTRMGAAVKIVKHVTPPSTDTAYAVKRLVRGICSSREAARQGFASCLAEVLTVLPEEQLSTPAVLGQILSATQTAGSMKGIDERELLLGRLVGISALARSGRLVRSFEIRSGDEEIYVGEEVMKVVVGLYQKRKWLRQAAVEAALLVVGMMPKEVFVSEALPLLIPLLGDKEGGGTLEVSDLHPEQLMLGLGLHALLKDTAKDAKGRPPRQSLPALICHSHVIRAGHVKELIPVLKLSAASFPKVHAVWKLLWEDVGLTPRVGGVKWPGRGSMGPKRLSRLGEVWNIVVDSTLTSGSLNLKGTAILLLKQVIACVPASGVWQVLSTGIVRLLLNHAQSEKNYLHELVILTLNQLPAIIDDDEEVQLEVVACLLRRGTLRFDARTGVKVIERIVAHMGEDAVDRHMSFLKGVVEGTHSGVQGDSLVENGTGKKGVEASDGNSNDDNAEPVTAVSENSPETDVTDEESAQGSVAERQQAVEALHSLARGGVSKGKRLTNTASFFLEMAFFDQGSSAPPLPSKVREACATKFFSLAGDIAVKPFFWELPASSPGEGQQGALEALWGLHQTWVRLEAGGKHLAKDMRVKGEEREAWEAMLRVVERIKEGKKGNQKGGLDKISSAFAGMLLLVGLYLLDGSKGEGGGRQGGERATHITDLIETYSRMAGISDGDDDEDEEEDGDGEPDPLAMLADILIAVVSEPSTHSVKSLRDVSRRVWGMVCGTQPLTKSALETLLVAVCGEEEVEEEEDEGDDMEDSEEEEGESPGEGKGDKDSGKVAVEVMAEESDKSDDEDEYKNEDEDGDDIVVDPSELEALLAGEEEEEGGLAHHAGADKALGALLGLKRAGRKKGVLLAERQRNQIRLRALDLLEVLCSRKSDCAILLMALVPLFHAIKPLQSSGNSSGRSQKGGEAAALRERLLSLYKSRLCRCKPRTLDPALKEGTVNTFRVLMKQCRGGGSKNPVMSGLAFEGALCCLRVLKGASSEDKDGEISLLVEAMDEVVSSMEAFFTTKRSSGLMGKQVEEVMRRFPEVSPRLMPVLVKAAAGSAPSEFLQCEAFRLLADVFNRLTSMDSTTRNAVKSQGPAILNALEEVLSSAVTARSASSNGVTAEAQKAKGSGNRDSNSIGGSQSTGASSILKAKRLKPVILCLSAVLKSDGGLGLQADGQSLMELMQKVGEASPSIAVQRLCECVSMKVGDANKRESIVSSRSSPHAFGNGVERTSGKGPKKRKGARGDEKEGVGTTPGESVGKGGKDMEGTEVGNIDGVRSVGKSGKAKLDGVAAPSTERAKKKNSKQGIEDGNVKRSKTKRRKTLS
ncbi:unnamed protein product [Choristocarpus tenellus]